MPLGNKHPLRRQALSTLDIVSCHQNTPDPLYEKSVASTTSLQGAVHVGVKAAIRPQGLDVHTHLPHTQRPTFKRLGYVLTGYSRRAHGCNCL